MTIKLVIFLRENEITINKINSNSERQLIKIEGSPSYNINSENDISTFLKLVLDSMNAESFADCNFEVLILNMNANSEYLEKLKKELSECKVLELDKNFSIGLFSDVTSESNDDEVEVAKNEIRELKSKNEVLEKEKNELEKRLEIIPQLQNALKESECEQPKRYIVRANKDGKFVATQNRRALYYNETNHKNFMQAGECLGKIVNKMITAPESGYVFYFYDNENVREGDIVAVVSDSLNDTNAKIKLWMKRNNIS